MVSLANLDGERGTLALGGPLGVWEDYPGISYHGDIIFDLNDIELLEETGSLKGLALHEMGHAIGVG